MTPDLMKSILAMDSYNRGYGQARNGIVDDQGIGNATVIKDSRVLLQNGQRSDVPAGFYAIAYSYAGETIISYRGTDGYAADALYGWPLGAGAAASVQGLLAVDFYRAVVGEANNPYLASVTTTGHSLGGGLAGNDNALQAIAA